jgi:hypothetical protein
VAEKSAWLLSHRTCPVTPIGAQSRHTPPSLVTCSRSRSVQSEKRRLLSSFRFPQSHAAEAIFGAEAIGYGRLINDIAPALFNEVYFFEAVEEFNAAPGQHKRRVYWTELLQRAHWASVASIVRATGWVDAATREYEAGNLYGWAAACRSLIEAAGDTLRSLDRVPLALATYHHAIRANLEGRGIEVLSAKDLEDDLIHFTHGRKIEKGAMAPDSHKARKPWEYVKLVENMEIHDVASFYAQLCEIVHPAAASVLSMIVEGEDGWRLCPNRQREFLTKCADENCGLLSEVLMACFNAPLLTLRVLHKFRVCGQIEALRKYPFEGIARWSRINAALRS